MLTFRKYHLSKRKTETSTMFLLKLHLFLLTPYGLILNSAASCPKGKVLLSFFPWIAEILLPAWLSCFSREPYLHLNKPLIVSIIKGQRLTTGKNPSCEDCKRGYFKDTEIDSQSCKVCRKCDKGEAWSTLLHLYFYGCKFPPSPGWCVHCHVVKSDRVVSEIIQPTVLTLLVF